MGYMIGEFSAITGISIYTLRYYEKENLIIPERKKMADAVIPMVMLLGYNSSNG